MAGKRNQQQKGSPTGSPTSSDGGGTFSKEQDRFLPIANVSRIMKKSLPANAKISKEAKESVQECVSEFISFVTGEASDKCQREKRKTINGDDLLWAMTTLGFDNYVGPLKAYLGKYRDTEGDNSTDDVDVNVEAVFDSNNNSTFIGAADNYFYGEIGGPGRLTHLNSINGGGTSLVYALGLHAPAGMASNGGNGAVASAHHHVHSDRIQW
ncbi:Nuclear transcription factor Y subunit B-3 [Linum grandiflorum]